MIKERNGEVKKYIWREDKLKKYKKKNNELYKLEGASGRSRNRLGELNKYIETTAKELGITMKRI